MTQHLSTIDDPRRARAALSRLIEPGDLTGAALVQVLGPVAALRLVAREHPAVPASVQQDVADLLGAAAATRRELHVAAGLERWRPRLADAVPERDLATIERLGGGLLTPEDAEWPRQLEALGPGAPLCLWWRGQESAAAGLGAAADRLVSFVGSRDATEYGVRAAHELVAPLVGRGLVIVSGGAYGIDAAAHRAALATQQGSVGPATIAVMAGGVDRFYPAGNEDLLRAVASQGVVLAEVPPGASPTRWRFLLRNRLIAALCRVTVVVEARWRSGALTTARRAAEIGRDVGAVPGSIFSANSAGCHRLLSEGCAVAVTRPEDVLELTGSGVPAGTRGAEADGTDPTASDPGRRPHDGLDVQDLLLYDALPARGRTTPDKLCSVAGLGVGAVLGGLSRLRARGLAVEEAGGWRRSG
ncbi:DNA-processing protein DprA [Zhihengliuella sp.]|uniref:DNA-processing protein DprA n=1 Tax=Zhihengliuella sp. TaxID=1954483 RepID=UPI0028109DDE|nr:DNA-processing protein DprA [Zhihengliuella sp.]